MTITYGIADCALGKMLVAVSDKGVCCVMLDDSAKKLVRELERRFPKAELMENQKTIETTSSSVMESSYELKLPLDMHGTPFQKSVWNALRKIPYGKTATYAEIAKKIGKPKAVRAVAQACGANHIALIVPCHRVIGSDGSISGYRWGVERKKALLEREKV